MDIIKAIPKTEEEIALARPRTRKSKNAAAREFGARLEQFRRVCGLSQTELAERVGMYQAGISDIERGDRLPDTNHVVAIAKVLRVSVDELLGVKGTKTNGEIVESRNIVRRVRRIAELPKRDRQALLRIIDKTLIASSNGQRVAA